MTRTLALATIIVVDWISAARAAPLTDSHTLFLNDCQPSGCVVHASQSSSDATTDTSDVVEKAGTVAAFSQGAAVWASVVSCVKAVMSPFDLTVTEQRPAQGPYFEVIVAGTPSDVGDESDLGALGDTSCSSVGQCIPFISKEVSFAFANAPFFANNPNEICGAAAQAIALSWTLDHVVDASDVMTFNSYTGPPSFHDGEACGSDCIGGRSPFGLQCTGTNGATSTHTCFGSGRATQNEVQTLLALFGPAPTPPDGGADGGQSDGGVEGGQSDGGVEGGQSEGGGDGSGGADGGGGGGASGVDAASSDARAGDAPVASSDGGRDAGGAGACAVNADCALGHYCDATVKMCTFDCRAATDCATGTTCNSLGMCVAKAATGGGGCGCRLADGSGAAAAPGLALLIALAALRLPPRRRRR